MRHITSASDAVIKCFVSQSAYGFMQAIWHLEFGVRLIIQQNLLQHLCEHLTIVVKSRVIQSHHGLHLRKKVTEPYQYLKRPSHLRTLFYTFSGEKSTRNLGPAVPGLNHHLFYYPCWTARTKRALCHWVIPPSHHIPLSYPVISPYTTSYPVISPYTTSCPVISPYTTELSRKTMHH